jgi:hypothetical protein
MTTGLFLTLACGIGVPASQPGVETIVAETLQALTQAAPTQESAPLTPDGVPVETAEVSFIIPNGVANSAASSTNTDVEYPYINPSNGDMPAHVTLSLDLYALDGTTYEPQIMIFRAAEYAGYSELTAATIRALQSLQYADGQALPEDLDADFTAQVHALDFKNGRGLRYLTQVFTNFLPVNNRDLFYYYQGITNDGNFFVQATLPINAPFLAADDSPNTALPADGIPFNVDDFTGYLDAVREKLNSAETFSFNPFLDALDEMIASMQVNGF